MADLVHRLRGHARALRRAEPPLSQLAAMSASPEQKINNLLKLVGAGHLWWDCCAEAARSRPEWLVEAYAALSREITRTDTSDEQADATFGNGDPGIGRAVDLLCDPALPDSLSGVRADTLPRAARSMAAIALSLTPRDERDRHGGPSDLVTSTVAHWAGVHALPVIPATSRTVPRPSAGKADLRAIADILDQSPAEGLAAAMTGVQALLLAGTAPSRLRRKRIGILLDATEAGQTRARGSAANPKGVLGTLTVTVLPGGPPGLFPDPRTMGFFEGDEQFVLALQNAWAYATRHGGARCVLWSVVTAPRLEPCLRIDGPSLGAAFAITVSEALGRPARLLSRFPAISLQMIKTECAVTGEVLGDGHLKKVDGIPGKVEALRGKKEFLVIAPEENQGEVTRPDSVTFGWAPDVRMARRLTRRISWRRVSFATTAVLAVALAIGIPLYLVSASQQNQRLRASVANQLVSTASQLNVSDPPLAMLLALQANAQNPSDRTRNGLLTALASDGSLVRTLHGHTAQVLDMGITTVGSTQFAVTGGFDGALRVWDLATGKCTDMVSGAEQGLIDAVAIDPVVPGIVLAAGVNSATLWTLTADGQLADPASLDIPGSGVASAAFSLDGEYLALGQRNGSITLVDPVDKAIKGTFEPWSVTRQSQELITSLTFGPDDHTIYAGDTSDSSGGNGLGNVYQVSTAATGSQPITLLPTGQHGNIASLSYVKRATGPAVLFIGSSEGVLAWDPAARRQLTPFPLAGISAPVSSIKSNSTITAVGTTTSGVTIVRNDELTTSGQPIPGTGGVALGSPNAYLLTTASRGDVYQWNLGNQPLATGSSALSVTATAFAPDGNLLAVDDKGELSRFPEKVPDGQRDWATSVANAGTVLARTMAIARVGGQQIAALGDWFPNDSRVVLVNIKTGQFLQAPQLAAAAGQCGGVRALAFTPDGTRLVVACWSGGLVSAWDTSTWKQVASVSLTGHIITMTITRDASTVVVGSSPGVVGSDSQPQSLWFLRLPDLRAENSPVTAHPGGVTSITSSGQRVYSGGWDGAIRSWTLDGHPTGHQATVNGEIFGLAYDAPSGLLIASTDDGLTFYDSATLTAISPTISVGDPGNGPQNAVNITLSPDGRYLAGTLENPTGFTGVDEWAATEPDWISQMCAKTTGNLTASEWATYGSPGIAAIPVCPIAHPGGPSPAPATPTSSSTLASSQFVGNWYVHGETLEIYSNATGVMAWNYGPCGNNATICTGNADVTFKVDGNTVIGTLGKIRYTSGAQAVPSDEISTVGEPVQGDSFRLSTTNNSEVLNDAWLSADASQVQGNTNLCRVNYVNPAVCGA